MSRQRRANGEEDTLLAQRLNQQQHLNARKERELAELRRALKSEQLELALAAVVAVAPLTPHLGTCGE